MLIFDHGDVPPVLDIRLKRKAEILELDGMHTGLVRRRDGLFNQRPNRSLIDQGECNR